MFSRILNRMLQSYGTLALLSLLAALYAESRAVPPPVLVWISPILIVVCLYQFAQLFLPGWRLRDVIALPCGKVAIPAFGLYLVLCFSPVNEVARYIYKTHPFQDYRWLMVSLAGCLGAFAFMNYMFAKPQSFCSGAAALCKKIWHIPAGYFLIAAAVWIFCWANFFSYAAFEHIPHVQDSIAQLFQAKIFAQGSLTAALPPIPEFFQYNFDNMIFSDRWYSQYPPAHPFFLMIGVLCGCPWIINPLFAAGSVVLLYGFACFYGEEKEARLSAALFCVSPFVLFMSASFMNHVSALFFLLFFLYGTEKALASGSAGCAFVAGLAIGIMFNIRPGEAAVVGFPLSLAFFIRGIRRRELSCAVCFSIGAMLMLLALLWYNYATNGDFLAFGYSVRWPTEYYFGFSGEPFKLLTRPPHSPFRGLLHTMSNAIALNQNLFEWPVPSLLPFLVFWTPFLFKKTPGCYLLLAGALAAPLFYFYYSFQDLCLGPRFYYICLPFVFVLTSKALFEIIKKTASLRCLSAARVTQCFIVLILVFLVYAACIRVPRLYNFYADSFWSVDNRLMNKVQEMNIDNALIFQKSHAFMDNDLGCGFLHNVPGLDSPVVFARDLGERNRELAAFFPGRSLYTASRTSSGDVVIEPLDILAGPDQASSQQEIKNSRPVLKKDGIGAQTQ
ncbi:MAG: glycosyltransferase family 39 protein [Deltaproteobacteria bacterium]|nr:glycosyltransferase family 39 protein [Deltaproteobacteria bacterium]